MKPQQKSHTTIDSYLSNIINESVRSTLQRRALQEKENQDLFGGAEKESGGDEEKSKLKKGDITSKDIIEKLNSIRSGKSFKDDAVSSALEGYIGDMTKAEKTALFAFLKGISQIVTGEIEGEEAVEPADDPASVEMEKSSGSTKVTIKPVIIKKAGKEEKSSSKPSEEDTSGPVPIKPKAK
jgi:hypothetical protein